QQHPLDVAARQAGHLAVVGGHAQLGLLVLDRQPLLDRGPVDAEPLAGDLEVAQGHVLGDGEAGHDRVGHRVLGDADGSGGGGGPGALRPTMGPIGSRSSRVVGSTPPRMTLPPRSTGTRSAMALASCSLWVMITTDSPRARSWRRPAKRVSTSWGASTLVGSSRMTSFAPPMSTLRISTRRRSAMEKWRTRAAVAPAG